MKVDLRTFELDDKANVSGESLKMRCFAEEVEERTALSLTKVWLRLPKPIAAALSNRNTFAVYLAGCGVQTVLKETNKHMALVEKDRELLRVDDNLDQTN